MADPTQVQEQKADAKATADATVATDPHAVHSVNSMPKSPKTLTSAAAGAGIGFLFGGPIGAALGGAAGYVIENKRIAGGPVGKIMDKVKALMGKSDQAAAAPTAGK